MRKMLTKEVTFTEFKVAGIEIVDGTPQVADFGTEKVLGNWDEKKAQKEMNKLYKDHTVTIHDLKNYSVTYEMEVEKFIEVAKVKEEDNEK